MDNTKTKFGENKIFIGPVALLKDNKVNYTKSCFTIPQRDALWIIIKLLFFVYIEFDLNTVQCTLKL